MNPPFPPLHVSDDNGIYMWWGMQQWRIRKDVNNKVNYHSKAFVIINRPPFFFFFFFIVSSEIFAVFWGEGRFQCGLRCSAVAAGLDASGSWVKSMLATFLFSKNSCCC
jgi:hypothetical protein